MIKKPFNLNGRNHFILAPGQASLASVLAGSSDVPVQQVCRRGECGACSLLLNGQLVSSCRVAFNEVPGHAFITTLEGQRPLDVNQAIHAAIFVHSLYPCSRCLAKYFSLFAELLENPAQTLAGEEAAAMIRSRTKRWCCRGPQAAALAYEDARHLLLRELTLWDLLHKWHILQNVTHSLAVSPREPSGRRDTWNKGEHIGILVPAGTLRMALVQSADVRVPVTAIDTAAAARMPGVYSIITHNDVKGMNRLCCPGFTLPREVEGGIPILWDGRSEPGPGILAVVCAETELKAVRAAHRVTASFPEDRAEQGRLFVTPTSWKGQQGNKFCEGFSSLDAGGRLAIYSKTASLPPHRIDISMGIGIKAEDLVLLPTIHREAGCPLSLVLSALLGVAFLATGRPVLLRYGCNMHDNAYRSQGLN
jgi:aldehyde oxidoreductase